LKLWIPNHCNSSSFQISAAFTLVLLPGARVKVPWGLPACWLSPWFSSGKWRYLPKKEIWGRDQDWLVPELLLPQALQT